ncbi:MAG: hypothetical protein IKS75_08815, partial [Clostridiales bacterium]|nr:hypothetical protein [Clostridiales bacterium]
FFVHRTLLRVAVRFLFIFRLAAHDPCAPLWTPDVQLSTRKAANNCKKMNFYAIVEALFSQQLQKIKLFSQRQNAFRKTTRPHKNPFCLKEH